TWRRMRGRSRWSGCFGLPTGKFGLLCLGRGSLLGWLGRGMRLGGGRWLSLFVPGSSFFPPGGWVGGGEWSARRLVVWVGVGGSVFVCVVVGLFWDCWWWLGASPAIAAAFGRRVGVLPLGARSIRPLGQSRTRPRFRNGQRS